jgi:hypothetical protein
MNHIVQGIEAAWVEEKTVVPTLVDRTGGMACACDIGHSLFPFDQGSTNEIMIVQVYTGLE